MATGMEAALPAFGILIHLSKAIVGSIPPVINIIDPIATLQDKIQILQDKLEYAVEEIESRRTGPDLRDPAVIRAFKRVDGLVDRCTNNLKAVENRLPKPTSNSVGAKISNGWKEFSQGNVVKTALTQSQLLVEAIDHWLGMMGRRDVLYIKHHIQSTDGPSRTETIPQLTQLNDESRLPQNEIEGEAKTPRSASLDFHLRKDEPQRLGTWVGNPGPSRVPAPLPDGPPQAFGLEDYYDQIIKQWEGPVSDALKWCKKENIHVGTDNGHDWRFDETAALHLIARDKSAPEAVLKQIISHTEAVAERTEEKLFEKKNKDGFTPMQVALQQSNTKAARRLLEAGAFTTLHDCNSREIVDALLQPPHEDASTLIRDRIKNLQSSINRTDDHDKSPLYLACEQLNVSVVSTLLAHDANPNQPGPSARTPLIVTIETSGDDSLGSSMATRRVNIIRKLISKGANPRQRDQNGMDALRWCKNQNCSSMIEEELMKHKPPTSISVEFPPTPAPSLRSNSVSGPDHMRTPSRERAGRMSLSSVSFRSIFSSPRD